MWWCLWCGVKSCTAQGCRAPAGRCNLDVSSPMAAALEARTPSQGLGATLVHPIAAWCSQWLMRCLRTWRSYITLHYILCFVVLDIMCHTDPVRFQIINTVLTFKHFQTSSLNLQILGDCLMNKHWIPARTCCYFFVKKRKSKDRRSCDAFCHRRFGKGLARWCGDRWRAAVISGLQRASIRQC